MADIFEKIANLALQFYNHSLFLPITIVLLSIIIIAAVILFSPGTEREREKARDKYLKDTKKNRIIKNDVVQ